MIKVRKSTPGDIPLLADFQLRLAQESENITLNNEVVVRGIQALFDEPVKGVYYIAEVDGKPAGCHLITYEWSDWRNGTVWWLQSVYVVKEYRKSGVFKAMFGNLMELIRNNDEVLGLRLYVDKSNVSAQQVYASMGMNGDHYTVFEWMKRRG